MQSGDPYASHLPTLRFVLALLRPKSILELGVGLYSTPLFLDHVRQHGGRLHSIETSVEWVKDWLPAFADDRMTLRLVENIATAVPDLFGYDLVFVDDSDNATDRERTIRAVLSKEHPVTVIHDAEVSAYRHAIIDLAEHVRFDDENPQTAVVW